MNHPNPFSRYAEQAGIVAQQMLTEPDNTPVTFGNGVPGSLGLFKWAGHHVHRQTILRLGESVPPIMKRRSVLYGMLVISRFVYMSEWRAHALELGPDAYTDALTHPATFTQTLGALATRDNRVAQKLEISYGLCGDLPLAATSPRYAFEADGSIGMTGLEEMTQTHRARLEAQGAVIQDDAVCAAHRAEALEDIFGAVAPVYATHPALGGAIFSEAQSALRRPAAFAMR